MPASRCLCAALIASLLSSCGSTGSFSSRRVPTARTAEDIGTLSITGISATRWQDVAGDLESKFPIKEDQLLNDAVPITSTVTDRILDVMIARLGINLAGTRIADTSGTSSSTTAKLGSSTTDGVTSETSSSSSDETTSDSTSRSRTTPDIPGLPDTAEGGAAGIGTPPARVSGVDAFTRYTAANALRQEIVMLNRYVRDAVRRTGYEPYLVRLNFNVQPRRRSQPFDALMRVSFIPSERKSLDGDPAKSVSTALETGAKAGASTFAALFGMSSNEPEPGAAPLALVTPADDYSLFANLFRTLGQGSTLTQLGEDAASYRLVVRTSGTPANFVIKKPCFFRNLAAFLSREFQMPEEKSYNDLRSSGRFAPGFFEQLGSDLATLDRMCGPLPPAAVAETVDPFKMWQTRYRQARRQPSIVVPLVATDNIEGTREYQAAQTLRQAALALSAVGGPVGLSSNFGRTLDRLREYEATRLNSIYSIGRLAENVVQVRLGASRFGDRFEMVPRNIQSTLLLLVPREQAGSVIDLVGRPSFTNAETGEDLRLSDVNPERKAHPKDVYSTLVHSRLAERHCSRATDLIGCRQFLTQLAALTDDSGGWPAFEDMLVGDTTHQVCKLHTKVDPDCMYDLWAELQREEEALSVVAKATLDVPSLTVRDLPPVQVAAARADGTLDRITLVGVDPWLKGAMRGRAGGDCRQADGDSYMATRFDVAGDVGTFTFPKRDLGKDAKGAKIAAPLPATLCVWLDSSAAGPLAMGLVDGSSPSSPRVYTVAASEAEPKASPAFILTVPAQNVATDRNKGIVRLEIKFAEPKQIDHVRLTAEGGVIVDATGAVMEKDAYAATVAGDARVALTLDAIETDVRKIRIIATAIKDKKPGLALSADVRASEIAQKPEKKE